MSQNVKPKVDSDSSSTTTSLCPNDYSGPQPYLPNCNKYTNCWKGKPHVQPCAPGTQFNARYRFFVKYCMIYVFIKDLFVQEPAV
jgi:hypothetical protein